MNSYNELLALTQLYISQTFPEGGWVFSDLETANYFRSAFRKAEPKLPKSLKETPKMQPAGLENPVKQPEELKKKQTVSLALQTEKNELANELRKPQSFGLTPLPQAIDDTFDDIREILEEKFPQQLISPNIQSETDAKVILFFPAGVAPKQQSFIQNLLKAIRSLDIDVAICSELKSIRPQLLISTRECYLKSGLNIEESSLFFLSDLSVYLSEPLRKAELWRHLRQRLQSL